MKGLAKATSKHERVSKVHRNWNGVEPTAKRNRLSRTRTKCGALLTYLWPFEVTPENACQLCFPEFRPADLDPVTAEARRLEESLPPPNVIKPGLPLTLVLDGEEREFVPVTIQANGGVHQNETRIDLVDRGTFERWMRKP